MRAPTAQGHKPAFPCPRLIVSPAREHRTKTEREREGERSHLTWSETFTYRGGEGGREGGRERKQETCLKLETTRRPSHLPFATPAQHGHCIKLDIERQSPAELHISISITALGWFLVLFLVYLKLAHLVVVDFTAPAGILWGHKLRSL